MRNSHGSQLALLMFCAAGLLSAAGLAVEPAAPNIVVILADDLGYGDLGCYGATKVETPNIDRLAAAGMRFTDAHSPHSVCTPTRYGLLTGRYCWRTWAQSRGVWSNDPLLIDSGRLTLPRMLQQAGYKTACIGKWHLGFGAPGMPGWDDRKGPNYNLALKPGPLEIGFDYFFGIPHVGQQPHVYIENHRVVGLAEDDPLNIVLDRRTAQRASFRERFQFAPNHRFEGGKAALYDHEDVAIELTEKAVAWIDEQSGQKTARPFFLCFAHRNVHAPLRPHAKFRGRSEIGVYGDFVAELDWSVGQILQSLDRNGFAKNTLVLFSSDNGAVQAGHRATTIVDYQGHRANGVFRGQKTEVYEGGHRVPLLVRWPGHVGGGSRSNKLVALTDVLATVAELLGKKLSQDAGEDSFSFLDALQDRAATQPQRESLVHDSNQGQLAIRRGPWKLIACQGGGGIGWNAEKIDSTQPPRQLYNLDSDPGEQRNLYNVHPKRAAELAEELIRIRQRGRSRD